jgi:site-specific DNA recombinase
LNNIFYAGVMRFGGDEFRGNHQPLVSLGLFQRVQDILSGRFQPKAVKHDFTFARRFVCGGCRYSLSASQTKGHVYYRCYVANCETTSVREEILAAEAERVLRTCALPDPLITKLCELVDARRQTIQVSAEERRRAAMGTVEVLDKRLKRLSDLYLDTEIDRNEYVGRRSELVQRREEFARQAENADVLALNALAGAKRIFELSKRPDLLFKMGDKAQKRQILDFVTCNRQVLGKSVGISLAPPFDSLAEIEKGQDGTANQYDLRTLNALVDLVLDRLHDENTTVRLSSVMGAVTRGDGETQRAA